MDLARQRWLHDLRHAEKDLAIITESRSPEALTRRLIGGTLDVAIVPEPAQLNECFEEYRYHDCCD